MTKEEQFATFGCSCRALLALANKRGNPITKDKFIEDFSKKYTFWERIERCGITDTGLVLDIARELKIGDSFQVFISKKEVRDRIIKKTASAILLFTEKKKDDDGKYSDYFHCAGLIALQILPDSQDGPCFALVQINNDIQLLPPVVLPDTEIDRMVGYFLVIY
jgi:hypothetical protein